LTLHGVLDHVAHSKLLLDELVDHLLAHLLLLFNLAGGLTNVHRVGALALLHSDLLAHHKGLLAHV
jgi:hypothetical protein